MHADATLGEVKDLAHSMSLKNTLQDPVIGGAKGGIRYNHKLHDSSQVLREFLIDNQEIIKKFWNTGADLNTSNKEITTILEEIGIPSPFISLYRMLNENKQYNGLFYKGIRAKISHNINLENSATGFSVATTIRLILKDKIKKICVQGLGNVGSSLIYYCHAFRMANVVCIIEKEYCIYGENLQNYIHDLVEIKNDINKLEIFCKNKNLNFDRKLKKNVNQFLLNCLSKTRFDIFSPCATRYVITEKVYEVLLKYSFALSEHKYIIAGANNIFENNNIKQKILLDKKIFVIPEWLSNCGNSIMFNEVLKNKGVSNISGLKILGIIEERISKFLDNCNEPYALN